MSLHPDYGHDEHAPEWGDWIDRVPHTEPRNVLAVFRFRGEPGREKDAAEAWAFELTYFFLRGVGEAPRVEYENGTYTCTGLMTTTHPADRAPVTVFNGGDPSDLGFCLSAHRRTILREMYPARPQQLRFDGRDNPSLCPDCHQPMAEDARPGWRHFCTGQLRKRG